MKENPTIKILKEFLDLSIFQIDGDGNILEVILNTNSEFNVSSVKNIYDLFVREDLPRIDMIFKMRLEDSKKFVKLSPRFNIDEYVDVELKNIEGNIYLSLKFFNSNREREIMHDRRIGEFAQMAEQDSLTGLLNRYGYWERVRGLLNCGDPDRELGILVVDMDNLKKINDEKGHRAGDNAINQISHLISNSIRKRDVAVRYGGDEFLVVVEEVTGRVSTGYGLAKRLLKSIKDHKHAYLTTVSIGVHIVKVGDFEKYLSKESQLRKKWDESVQIADEMTYKAKEGGRNQVVFSKDI